MNKIALFIVLITATIGLQAQIVNTPVITPATIPYYCDFEDTIENNNWVFSNANSVNQWIIEAPIDLPNPLIGNALFVSANNGATNHYNTLNSTTVVASRTIVSTGASVYILSFDIYIGGEYNSDYLKLYVTDEDTNYVGVSGSTTPYYGSTSFNLNQYLVNFDLTQPYFNGYTGLNQYTGIFQKQIQLPYLGPAGTIKKIVFVWHNNNNYGNQPSSTIDNISLASTSCIAPTSLSASNIQNNSLQLSWIENGNANLWTISYKKKLGNLWITFQTNQNPYTITGLDHSTYYDFKVRSECIPEESVFSNVLSVNTLCDIVTQFPWNEGFEYDWQSSNLPPSNTQAPNCWININGGGNITKWQLSSSAINVHSGYKGAQHYSENSTNINHDYLISPIITLTGNERLRFWYKGQGLLLDYIKVGIYDINQIGHDINSINDTSFFTTILPYTLADPNLWKEKTVYLNNYSGTYRLAFIRNNSGYISLSIDDIVIEQIPVCPEPATITAVPDTNGALISWIPFSANQSTYYLYYKQYIAYFYDSVLVNGTQYNLTNLNSDDTYDYYVRAVCGTTLSESSPIQSFTTLCSYITTLPYNENFDTYGVGSINYPDCWVKNSVDMTYPNIGSTNYSTPGALRFYVDQINGFNFALTPKISPSIPIQSLRVSFKMRTSDLNDTLFVGVVSDPTDMSTYVQIGFCTMTATNQFESKELYFSGYIGNGHFIAFKTKYSPANTTVYIDNLSLNYAQLCPNPTNLMVSNVGDSSATIHWIENGSAQMWNIEYGPVGFTLGTGYTQFGVTSNSLVIQNLIPNTSYQIYLQSNCSTSLSQWSIPLTFTTLCESILAMPWSENFDTYGTTSTSYPLCWKKLSSNTNFPYITNINNTPPGALYFSNSQSGYLKMAITPKVHYTIPINTLKLDLKMRSPGLDDTLFIGIISNTEDINSFELISKQTVSSVNTWQNIELFLSSYNGVGTHIALLTSYGTTSSTVYVDDFVLNYIPNCPAPSNLTATNVLTSQASITWVVNGNSTQSQIEYGPDGFTHGSGTLISGISSSNYDLNNLIPQTNYDIYIRSICNSSDTSSWSTPLSLSTLCATITGLPYVENFDQYSTGIYAYPGCWQKISNVANYPYINGTNYSSSGSLNFNASNAGQYNFAVLPPIDTSISINSLKISFKLRLNNIVDSIQFGIMSNPYDTSTFEMITKIGVIQASNWYDKYITLSNYTGYGKYLAFKINNSGVSYSIGYIDNINIDYIPNCPLPIDLQKTGASSNSLTITWNEVGSTSTWDIEYGPVGFTHGTGTLLQSINSNPFTINGLNAQTSYQIYVRSYCGSEYSEWCTPIVANTSCGIITQLPWYDSFDYYGYGTNVTPACWSYLTSSANGVYISTTYSSPPGALCISIPPSGGYNFVISPEISNLFPMSSLRVEFKARGSLTDTIYIGVMSNPIDTATFTLIAPVVLTSTQYANVGVNFNTYSGNGNYIVIKTKNLNYFSSFYIDNFKIRQIPNCGTPIQLTVTDITDTSATLKWTDVNSAIQWNLEYGLLNFVQGSGIILTNLTDTSVHITNLSPLTTYQFYVQANCGFNQESLFSDPYTFTTECSPITTVPWSEPFDSYGTGSGIIPPCFTRLSYNIFGSYPQIVSSPTFSAPGSLSFTINTFGAYNCIILPRFGANLNINKLKLNFKLRISSLTDTLYVGVISDKTNINSFETVHKVLVNAINSFQDIEILLDSYSGTGKYVAFLNRSNSSSTNLFIDNLIVDTIPFCPAPTYLTATNITSNSITLGFLAHGNGSIWEIEYGPVGFTHGNGTIISNITTNPYIITGLSPTTSYQVYIRTVCSSYNDTIWSIPFSVTTGCTDITTLPWSESFDTYGTNNTYPVCWRRLSSVSNNPQITSVNYSAPGSLQFNNWATALYNFGIIPPVSNSISLDSLHLSFKLKTSYISDSIQIGVMTNPTDTSSFTTIEVVGNPALNNWYDHVIYFNNYSGIGKYLAFKTIYHGTSSLINLDNVVLSRNPSCIQPNHIIVAQNWGDSVLLQWNSISNPLYWTIEYGPTGFTQGNGTTIQTLSNPYTLYGLNLSTSYDLYIRSVCSPGDTSNWSSKTIFTTIQVPAITPYSMDFENPSGFQFENLSSGNGWFVGTATNNTTNGTKALYVSGNNGLNNQYITNSPSVVWAYRDIYFTPSTSDYILTIDWKGNGETISNSKRDYMNIYLGDLVTPTANNSGIIMAPNGSILIGNLLNMQNNWASEDFNIPVGFCSGTVKRLFFCWINDSNSGTQPPAAIDNLYLTSNGIINCIVPTNLTVDSLTDHAATISWSPGSTENRWQFEYRPNGTAIWNTQIVNENPSVHLTELENNTHYNIRVKSLCTLGESNYTQIMQFTTPEIYYYTIVATSSPYGTITPNGEVLVQSGFSRTFQIIPDPNNVLFGLIVDNEPVEIQYSYTFTNVSANHTIHAEYIFDGIQNQEYQNSVLLIPNPANQFVEIRFQQNAPEKTKVWFYNVFGQHIMDVEIKEQNQLIDISQLSPGIYLLQIKYDNTILNLKLLKE